MDGVNEADCIHGRLVAGAPKRGVVVLTGEPPRGLSHRHDIEPVRVMERIAATERARDLPSIDSVPIMLSESREAGMELGSHFFDVTDADVGGETSIDRATQSCRGNPGGAGGARHLPRRVNAPVGPARSLQLDGLPKQSRQCLLDHPLDGSGVRLTLPAVERCPVVLDRQLHIALRQQTAPLQCRVEIPVQCPVVRVAALNDE